MLNNKFSLKNQFSLITGAGGLLGEQHAIALLEVFSDIILTDIDYKKLVILKKKLEKVFLSSKIFIYKMDVTNEKSIMKIRNDLLEKKIKLKVLINNAAIDPKVKNNHKLSYGSFFESTNIKNWNKQISVGLSGAMLCSKIFGSLMIKNKQGGVILNIASDLSVIAPNHSIYKKNYYKPVMYSVVKHGLIGLTKYLATYWNNKNIRCNAISPGGVENNQSKDFINKIKKLIPLNRLAKKDEYKSAIQFLCTDASSYMTGHNLIMDGGRSIW
jgi:NAD(P)-dependent dehydrogenase (short-subunit alcohol dehydrogenase family)